MDISINDCDFLDIEQQQILLDYASGKDASAIGHGLCITPQELRMLELDTRAALNAKTTPHMISRAWQLGILSTKCLCLVLACLSAQPTDTAIRTSRQGRSRAPTSIARIKTGAIGRNLNA